MSAGEGGSVTAPADVREWEAERVARHVAAEYLATQACLLQSRVAPTIAVYCYFLLFCLVSLCLVCSVSLLYFVARLPCRCLPAPIGRLLLMSWCAIVKVDHACLILGPTFDACHPPLTTIACRRWSLVVCICLQ